ncbi:fructosamine kinase family protein [Celeribacter litoreus]|uniref:fructosamine kinase family protein n=1 Tax=Celeribacter litoreus TaxID=2876714 RepID=UPI001CC9994A|nr:fructosamine kinase family protein [Celeribacter litoreus]MCA0045126.1 fructosamine kinase family protein [Celeribacter litoreus]
MSSTDLRTALEHLGFQVRSIAPLHGGDLSDVFRFESDHETVVAKSGQHVGIEARMLREMAKAGAPVPAVIAATDTLIVMEHLSEVPPTAQGWIEAGAALRTLHETQSPQNGWTEDYAFGSVKLNNRPATDWPSFWAERRLLPFAELFPDIGSRLERVCDRLPELIPHNATNLLHGDLWSGNLLFSTRGAQFIDPACYHGDAEVDLAMLHLFGAPPPAFWEGYGEPASDWHARRPLYQLFPALVHLALFGDGYRGLVERCLVPYL